MVSLVDRSMNGWLDRSINENVDRSMNCLLD